MSSLADAFRLRGEVGYELEGEAPRNWLRRGGKPTRLIEIASRLPRAKYPVLHYRRWILHTEIVTFDELYERARFIVGE